MQLTREAWVQALKSPTVTLIVGDTGERIPCASAFLALHSEYFAKILSKPGASEDGGGAQQLQLPRVTKISVECFVHWCHQGQPLALGLGEDPSKEEIDECKDMLIDLWIFTDEHNIGRLQNECMSRLLELLGSMPFLLTAHDIKSIFSRTPDSNSPLRSLAILVLVAQLHAPNSPTKVDEFNDLMFTGAMGMMYKAMRNWAVCVKSMKSPEESPLLALLSNPKFVDKLMVKEDDPPMWVLTLCGIGPKPAAAGVRSEPIEVD